MGIKDKLKNNIFFEGFVTGIAYYLRVKIIVSVIAIIIELAIKAV